MKEIGYNHKFALLLMIIGCVNLWYITLLCKRPPSGEILLSPSKNEFHGLLYGLIICFLAWMKKIHVLAT